MPHSSAQYISASRRNDLPRFFYNEFYSARKKGEITYDGGYGRSYTVSLKQEDVSGYIFWSKDFSRFIGHPQFGELIRENNAVFHFTINDMPALEPRIPPLEKRLETLARLCDLAGPERVLWRYDPLCKYVSESGIATITDTPFYAILKPVAAAGITRCYFSFMTAYKKLGGRGIDFEEFTLEEKREIAAGMRDAASAEGLTLYNCCNKEIPSLVPGIRKAHCVDNDLLKSTDRFGVHRELKIKPTRSGCGCFESRDIGSYAHVCPHGCRYCYANPEI
ncbi:MAG: DUF1848 family protein [Chitinivibrionales bacterium]|nr:DUF1848 family protein [Chitinivibrionales bacterium]